MNRLVILYEENYKFYFAIVFRVVGNVADTEDILQIAFLKAYRSNTSHIRDGDLKKWFVTVCKNTAITYINKETSAAEREKKYFLESRIQQNIEDETIFNIILEQYLAALPSEFIPYFKEHLIDDVPIREICRKYGVNRDKMRYWKKQLKKFMKNIF